MYQISSQKQHTILCDRNEIHYIEYDTDTLTQLNTYQ